MLLTFDIKRTLPGTRSEVFRVMSNLEEFSASLPNVRKVILLKKGNRQSLVEWSVEVEGLPISWRQENIFNRSTFTIDFRAVSGDLEDFEGQWILRRLDDKCTEVIVKGQARLGIPLFESVVRNVLQERLQKNFQIMVETMEDILVRNRYQRNARKSSHPVKGFAVMGHPYNLQHLIRYFEFFKPDVRKCSPEFLLRLFEMAPTFSASNIIKFHSGNGQIVDGHFILCPIIPDMITMAPERVFAKVLEGCRLAERLGIGVMALGGFTSIVGEKYFDRLKTRVKIPITTGNTLTAALALEGLKRAGEIFERPLKDSTAVIIGGTGDIGSACARVLAKQVRELIITGRTPLTLKEMQKKLRTDGGAKITVTLDNNAAVEKGDFILAAASATQSLVDLDRINPGAIVCDVGYPKNISYKTKNRKDIFVFSGGLASVPTPFNLGFDVGLPSPKVLYGCFAEAIILSLEERFENFSEGKGNITPEKIEWIMKAAKKHGFQLAPFYWGDEIVDPEHMKSSLLHRKAA